MPTDPGNLALVVLAAGKGTRMKSDLPKVLHPLAGRPMIESVLAAGEALAPARTVVVVGPDMAALEQAVAPRPCVVQQGQRGTGDAVRAAAGALADHDGDVLVLYGDTPLVRAETLAALAAKRRDQSGPGVVVMGFETETPGAYGRVLTGADGRPTGIVEARDATPEQAAITLCNGGLMAVHGPTLFRLLEQVGADNAKGEYYLTDVVGLAAAEGLALDLVTAEEEEVLGVNSRAELAVAEAVLQQRLRAAAMAAGATLIDPTTVYFSRDTAMGRDVVIEPSVFIGPGVTIADGVTVRAFSHLEGATLAAGATVGPYARLRPGTVVGEGAKVGNFVETKNATLAEGAKANHLTYLGDCAVGAKANIGAGTITCNYDGFAKHRTTIGAGAFVGSNTALVAPVELGDGALVGAGSTITRDVPGDALAVTRGEEKVVPGGAARLRERLRRQKDGG